MKKTKTEIINAIRHLNPLRPMFSWQRMSLEELQNIYNEAEKLRQLAEDGNEKFGWRTNSVECEMCKRTHDPRGYGKTHTCPHCFTVLDFSKIEGAYK